MKTAGEITILLEILQVLEHFPDIKDRDLEKQHKKGRQLDKRGTGWLILVCIVRVTASISQGTSVKTSHANFWK